MGSRLRVAITLEQCWHKVPGGTATSALGLVRALVERDDVEVIAVAARHRAPAPDPFQPPVAVRHLPLPRPLLYEAWHSLRRPAVQMASGPVDVVHATTLVIPPRRRAPLVVTIHDLAFLHEPSHFTRRGLRFFRRGLELARRDADLVLCSSIATLHDCLDAGFPAARLRHVPLGVDPVVASPADVERVRAVYGLRRRFVLFVGTREPRKNLDGLLEAELLLDEDHDLVLAGPHGWGPDAVADVQLPGDRVLLLGFVPQSDLAALYAAADVFCYPSFREGFGLPVVEAMAQGTPVVTSSGTSTEEVAGGAAVLVDPADPASIADGIRRALHDTALREELARRGRVRASELTSSASAERTLAVYREVASS